MFSVFGSEWLDKIDDNVKGNDFTVWKNLSSTKWCCRNLFKTMRDGSTTFMDTIHHAVWKPEDQTDSNRAYAYAVCDAILDPTILEMRMTEAIITPRLSSNYRSRIEQLLDNEDENPSEVEQGSVNEDENTTEVEIEKQGSDNEEHIEMVSEI